MARKTRFKTDDLVKVKYRTTALSGSYIGKVIQYNSERRQYLVAVYAQENANTNSRLYPVPSQSSIWCRVAELSFATDDDINYLKGMDHVGTGKDFLKGRLKQLNRGTASPPRSISSRMLSRILLTAYRTGLSVPKNFDVSASPTSYLPIERWQYFRSSI